MRAIVFSRDRPMQLDLLLTSLERNAPDFEPHVLWYAGTEFVSGYGTCQYEHSNAVFIREDGLTYQVRSLLKETTVVAFFTDDDVLFRPITERRLMAPEMLCFSLRLGENTTFCYPHDREQELPDFVQDNNQLRWDWTKADGDFSYPMSLDGHIFRSQDVLSLIAARNFSNPNRLEDVLMQGARSLGRPLMASYRHSRLVGIPLNRVNQTHPNRSAGGSEQELNERYLKGERFSLDAIDFSQVRGAHQEIDLEAQ